MGRNIMKASPFLYLLRENHNLPQEKTSSNVYSWLQLITLNKSGILNKGLVSCGLAKYLLHRGGTILGVSGLLLALSFGDPTRLSR